MVHLFYFYRKGSKKMEQSGLNLIIHVDKEIDHCTADKVRKEFEKKFIRGNVINVIFDMGEVEFMDSSGIGMIIGRYTRVKCVGGRVVLAAVPEKIDRLLRMSGVYSVVGKYDTVIQALEGLCNEK